MKMMKLLSNYFKLPNTEEEIQTLKNILKEYQMGNLDVSEDLLNYLCTVAKNNRKHNEILVITCHIVSNLALDEDYALFLIEMGIIDILTKMLHDHQGDRRLVWKCTSALWNLCRPVGIANQIPSCLPRLVLECLLENQHCPKATHTCFGALSNLALCKPNEVSNLITSKHFDEILQIVWKYKDVANVTGHFGAMIANISVVENIARICVENDAVRVIINCLNNCDEKESVKHLVAALHNISDVPQFPYYFCDCKGIEILLGLELSSDIEIIEFINGMFELSSMPSSAKTSLQIACVCCDLMLVVDLLKRNGDLTATDSNGKNCLQLAIEHKKGETIQLLLASGAKLNQKTFREIEQNEEMKCLIPFIEKGTAIRMKSERKFLNTMLGSRRKINKDVCSIVTECIPGVDLLLVLQ